MKKLFLTFLTFVSLGAFAQNEAVINDANAQQRTVGSFNAITVSDGIQLFLTQSATEAVAVSAADEKYLSRLKTEVENGTLKIYFDRQGFTWTSDKKKLKAYVSFKTLEKLQASSGANVTAKSSLELGDLAMKFTSGAEFTGKLTARNLSVDQNSGSELNLSGTVEKIHVDLSSGASLNGYDLAVDFCDAEASSGASVHITINKELNARASSGGGIKYKGSALIRDISISSGGLVKKA